MTTRVELRRIRNFTNNVQDTVVTDISTDEQPTKSKTRVRSEPSKPLKIPIINKSHLPEIENNNKRLSPEHFPEPSRLLTRGSNLSGLYLKNKEKPLDDSSPEINRSRKHFSNSGRTDLRSIHNTSFKEAVQAELNPKHKVAASLLGPIVKNSSYRQAPPSGYLRLRSQKQNRIETMPNEKVMAQELSDTNIKNVKARVNLQSNLNLKPRKVEPPIKTENLSTSINLSHVAFTLEASKCSSRKNGIIEAYAANSHRGIVRSYNEDRVSIILNITQPSFSEYKGEWPNCSFFGIYDGHGGSKCADFLKDSLHRYVIGNKNFPQDPQKALIEGFKEAEEEYLEIAQQNVNKLDQSGSCALVVLIVGNKCFVANVGDSRALMSLHKGKQILALSKDHKPGEEGERKRILSNGGKVYQTQISPAKANNDNGRPEDNTPQFGPPRVFPGRLSVSRTFGDVEAKLEKYGGLPNVVIAEPEIRTIEITKDCDFIVLGSDGIYDRLSDQDISDAVWTSLINRRLNVHEQNSEAIEAIMTQAVMKQTYDNITTVMVSFSGFKAMYTGEKEEEDKQELSYYVPLENKLKAQRSASNPRTKIGLNPKETNEENNTSRNNSNNVNENVSMSKYQKKLNISLAYALQNHKISLGSNQLVKAYKKQNLLPLPK